MSQNTDDSPIEDTTESQIEKAERVRTPKSFKPTKIIGFPQRRIDIIFKGENGKPSGYMQIKKKKSEQLTTKILPKIKRNPDKFTFASIGSFPAVSQIYTYKNNDSYTYISNGVDSTQLRTEDFYILLVQLLKVISDRRDLTEQLIAASLSMELKHINKPYLKIGLDMIKEFNLEDVFQEFAKESKEKNRVWK